MKTFVGFLIVAGLLLLADLAIFFIALARDFGIPGLLAWLTLHVAIGAFLIRRADRVLSF